ncbi:MAG: sialidase family protein [Bacteroidota bacterium]
MKPLVIYTLLISVCLFIACKKKDKNDLPEEVPPMAAVSTRVVSAITDSTAIAGGNVSSGGSSALTAVGVCWDKKPNPTINSSHTNNGASAGDFVSQLINLKVGTTYYVRAYATNASGTSYGEELAFKTSGIAKWKLLSKGPPAEDFFTLEQKGSTLYAGTSEGVYTSVNDGVSWTAKNSGMTTNTAIWTLAFSGDNIFAGTGVWSGAGQQGIFRSGDNGNSWSLVNNGLADLNVGSIVVSGSTLFAATWAGVYKSTDAGNSWTAMNSGLSDVKAYSLALLGSNLFATTAGGVFVISTSGGSWTAVNNGLINFPYELLVIGTNLYAGAPSGIYISTNNGATWTLTSNHEIITALVGKGSNLYTASATSSPKVHFSNDNGATWTDRSDGMGLLNVNLIYCLYIMDNELFAGTDQGIYVISL